MNTLEHEDTPYDKVESLLLIGNAILQLSLNNVRYKFHKEYCSREQLLLWSKL